MTKEEVLKEYGDVPLKFSSYYKYSFSFYGEKNGATIYATIGGNADDIYRFELCADSKITLNEGRHNSATICDKDGKEFWEEDKHF